MGVSPFTVRVCPHLPLLFCASSMCVPCFCLSVPCVLVPFFVCGLCFSVWVCWVCVLLFLCSGVLVSSLGVYVSWYLCVLCVGGLVFVSGLCVLFPVVCGVLLDVFCVYVLCSCFLCGGLVWGCVSACGVLVVGLFGVRVSLGCSVYVSVLLIVWCLYWFVVLGVLVVGLCLCGCGGFRGLGVCCFLFLGFGLVLFFGWLLGFCFLVGGCVLVWLVVCFCWLFGWFLLVVWVVFVCWGWVVASYFFGAILFVLIVVGLSGFLLASAFCLVLQPVF